MSDQANRQQGNETIDCVFYVPDREKPLCPYLLSAFKSVRHQPEPIRWYKHKLWVLDYAYTDLGLYKVGRKNGKKNHRLAFTAHLYALGTWFWEDMTAGPLPNCSTAVLFANGESVGLDKLTGSQGFAAFDDPQKIIFDIMEQLIKVGKIRGDGGFCQAQSFLYQILDILLTAVPSENGRYTIGIDKSTGDSIFVEQVKNFLKKHLDKKVALQQIANHTNVSLSTLTHRYRKETGESPMRSLKNYRLQKAAMLLLKGENLKNIASLTGFADEFHLSKAFKIHTGISPKNYRSRFHST